MGWMFPVKDRRIKRGGASILRTLSNWKRTRELCAAFSYKCLQSLFTLYVAYKQVKHYGLQQGRAILDHACTVTAEEKQELYQRLEALECAVDRLDDLDALAECLAELAGQVVDLQQETYRRIEALEGRLSEPDVSESRLVELESRIANLQQEIGRRLEVLEDNLSRSSTSEERLGKLENHVTYLQQEIPRRIETLEGILQGPDTSEEHLTKLASQVTDFQQEMHQRLEAALQRLDASEERFVELEGSITNLEQETGRRIEAFEGALQSLSKPEERLAELERQVAGLRQAFQAPGLSKPAAPVPEEQKSTLLTARGFAARHGVDWNQMQAWIDTQVLTPVLSAEGLPDYLLTPDQQSMLIRYWKSRKIPYTRCEECPHYVLFGSQTRLA